MVVVPYPKHLGEDKVDGAVSPVDSENLYLLAVKLLEGVLEVIYRFGTAGNYERILELHEAP